MSHSSFGISLARPISGKLDPHTSPNVTKFTRSSWKRYVVGMDALVYVPSLPSKYISSHTPLCSFVVDSHDVSLMISGYLFSDTLF